MKITTEFVVYKRWDDEAVQGQIYRLSECVEAFGTLSTCGLSWKSDWGDDAPKHVFVVESFSGDVEGVRLVPFDALRASFAAWCKRLADWCRDDADEDVGGDFEHKVLRVEIDELMSHGGTRIRCFDRNGDIDHEIVFAVDLDVEERGDDE